MPDSVLAVDVGKRFAAILDREARSVTVECPHGTMHIGLWPAGGRDNIKITSDFARLTLGLSDAYTISHSVDLPPVGDDRRWRSYNFAVKRCDPGIKVVVTCYFLGHP